VHGTGIEMAKQKRTNKRKTVICVIVVDWLLLANQKNLSKIEKDEF
jgi:hypothetical protein